MTSHPAIMLVSVGGAVSEGILESLAAYRDRLTIIGTTTDPSTGAARDCDVCLHVAPLSDEDRFERDIVEAIRVRRPSLVIPCRDADIPALARVKATDPAAGASLLVGSSALAEAMNDKLLMLAFMRDCGLAAAPTASTPSEARELLHTHGFPMIAKPRGGSGTKGVYVLFEERQLDACLDRGGFVFQPYIAPPPDFADRLPDPRLGVPFEQTSGEETFIAIRGLVDRQGDLAHVAKVDVVNRFGRPFRLTRLPVDTADRVAAERVSAVLHAEDYVGPFALQGRVDAEVGLIYFEMLTRLGGGTAGFSALGLNQSRLLVEMFTGLTLPDTVEPADVVEWCVVPRRVDTGPASS